MVMTPVDCQQTAQIFTPFHLFLTVVSAETVGDVREYLTCANLQHLLSSLGNLCSAPVVGCVDLLRAGGVQPYRFKVMAFCCSVPQSCVFRSEGGVCRMRTR